MKSDPLTTALRNVAETKYLLESLLYSSESFDYTRAKKAIGLLDRKIKVLGRLQNEMETLVQIRQPEIRVINFRAAPDQVVHL